MGNKNRFNFFVGAEVIEKAGKDKDGYPKELMIKGVASTNDKDSDDEILEPSGFVLDRFLKSGFLNLEHKSKDDLKYIIGEPTKAEIVNNELHIEGKLYKSSPIARGAYDTIRMLEKEGSNRKIGFSIEGKAIKRDPSNKKRIVKALITNCAVTQSAKNRNTFAEIVKGEQKDDYVQANGGQTYLLDITKPDGTRIKVDKDFNIKVDKAMSTESGSALMPESLDRNKKKKKDAKVLTDNFIKNMINVSKAMENGFIKEKYVGIVRNKVKDFFI